MDQWRQDDWQPEISGWQIQPCQAESSQHYGPLGLKRVSHTRFANTQALPENILHSRCHISALCQNKGLRQLNVIFGYASRKSNKFKMNFLTGVIFNRK